ncbi:MAG: cation-translocating P-type ATPase [Clostridia bacterium]|nr:cation-translocating P-type ATPase [Clostridia bacterium]
MEEKKYYQKSVSEVLKQFEVDCGGLDTKEVEKRLPESQKYAIKNKKPTSVFAKFLAQIKELMVLVLLVSGIISVVIGIVEGTSGEIVDGAIILGIVIMNAFFGVYQERKSEKAIESLQNLTRPETFVFRNSNLIKIKTSELVLGDIVSLQAGSIVPADLRLIESANIKINEASLTGESEAVEKDAEIVYEKKMQVSEQKNMAFAGSVVESGHAKGVVVALGRQSEIGKIAESLKQTKKELTPLQKNIQDVGKILTYLVLLVATITFILEVVAHPSEVLQAFLTAVAISVAAIPESMPAVITIIMSLGISKLSKQKAIVKKMHAVETLGACDVVCSDKTGTITQNKMKVEKVFSFFKEKDKPFKLLLGCMALCNDAKKGLEGYVGASTEVALVNFVKEKGIEKKLLDEQCPRVKEIPFSSQTKYMTTLNIVEGNNICYMKGALDRILQKCEFVQQKDGVVLFDENLKRKILQENQTMCKKSLRVIAFAYKQNQDKVIAEGGFVFLGLCGIQDPPRPETLEAVKKCKSAGMRTVMITGDYKDTAFAIAKSVGIAKSVDEVLSGEEIDLLSEEEFLKVVELKSVYARVSPAHKVKIVDALKKRGHIVAMTGDGVNDAPALKKADIGIGMGKSGTDVAKEVADMIITDDNFATIVVAVEEGRKIYSNIQKTIKYLFSANMAEILALFFITILLPGKTFLLPVQILFVNLITDSLPGIALGIEPVEKGVMLEKPRKKSDGLFANGVGTSIFILGAIQTILTMSAYLFGLYVYNEQVAITMAFYTLNFIQLFYMFTARTKESCLKSNPFKNKFFNLSLIVGFGLLLLIACTNLREVMQLTNLNFGCWVMVLALSVSIVFIGEIYKLVEKKLKNRKLH